MELGEPARLDKRIKRERTRHELAHLVMVTIFLVNSLFWFEISVCNLLDCNEYIFVTMLIIQEHILPLHTSSSSLLPGGITIKWLLLYQSTKLWYSLRNKVVLPNCSS